VFILWKGEASRPKKMPCAFSSRLCYECQKTGYFAKICEGSSSAAARDTSACVSTPVLWSLQEAPECLSFAVTNFILRKRRLSDLIDPGRSLSFVNEETAKCAPRVAFALNWYHYSSVLKGELPSRLSISVDISKVHCQITDVKHLPSGCCRRIFSFSKCLYQLFASCGMPHHVHSDLVKPFTSGELNIACTARLVE